MGEYLSEVILRQGFKVTPVLANSIEYCQPTMKVSEGLQTVSTPFCDHIPTMALKVNDDQK